MALNGERGLVGLMGRPLLQSKKQTALRKTIEASWQGKHPDAARALSRVCCATAPAEGISLGADLFNEGQLLHFGGRA